MKQNMEYRQQLVQEYKQMVSPLLPYLQWFVNNAGQTGSTNYRGDEGSEYSAGFSFPVYDATLMNFIREASKSALMEKNYSYTYTRNHIRTHEDERRLIRAAELKDWDLLRGILSRYVLGGRTRAVLWSEAVRENIFAMVLEKMRKIIEYWDKPLDDGGRQTIDG